ncbi:MAG: hypothetical protein K2G33_04455 [Duncaniella sp.]|nr:hypothetical protein [Duncaniella sp.]
MGKEYYPDSVISALMNLAKPADRNFPVHVFSAKIQRNPALRQLVDALQLELVGIEEYKPCESLQKFE